MRSWMRWRRWRRLERSNPDGNDPRFRALASPSPGGGGSAPKATGWGDQQSGVHPHPPGFARRPPPSRGR
jgi:hypothetical protein